MLLFIGLSLSILGGIFLPDILVVRLEGFVGIVVIVLLMFAATYYCLQKTNEMYRPFLAIVYLNGLVGLMSRLPFSSNYLQLIDDQVLVIITVLTSTGLFYLLSYRQFKQLKIAGNS